MLFGLADPFVAAAYLGCILMTLVGLIYGLLRRHTASDDITPLDRQWALKEQEVENER